MDRCEHGLRPGDCRDCIVELELDPDAGYSWLYYAGYGALLLLAVLALVKFA